MDKRLYHVIPIGGGVWDVMAHSAEDAISEIAKEIYGGDDTGLTAEVAPRAFMIYENGKKMSAFTGMTEEEAIEKFISSFRSDGFDGKSYTAVEILDDPQDGDDGFG